MKPILSAILGATLLQSLAVSAHAQSVPTAAAVAALRTSVGATPRRPFVLVPDSSGNAILAEAVANAAGARARSVADGRACRGFVPQCGWRAGGDTLALRVQVRSAKPDRILFAVETWGLLTNPTPNQSSFYERLLVEVVHEAGKWVTRRWWIDFAT